MPMVQHIGFVIVSKQGVVTRTINFQFFICSQDWTIPSFFKRTKWMIAYSITYLVSIINCFSLRISQIVFTVMFQHIRSFKIVRRRYFHRFCRKRSHIVIQPGSETMTVSPSPTGSPIKIGFSIIINKGFSIYYMIIASGIKRYHGFISQHVFPWTKRMGSFTTPDL